MTITDTSIRQWADRHDCRGQLPVLVRRLIRETTPKLVRMRFPGNDAVDLHGLDGETETETQSIWVPGGRAVWEMGCDQSPSAKAAKDYRKRTDATPAEVRQTSSFIFVTPRRWNTKQEWIDARRAEGAWKDVRAYDSVDLETWLDNTPATTRWLGERLDLMQPGLLTPEEWWRRWASASEPRLLPELVATRRQGEPEELLRKLRENESVVPVMADDSKEAVAFTIASAMQAEADDILDRMIVVTRADVSVSTSGVARLIIVVDLPEKSDVDLGDRQNVTLVRPYPKGRLDVQGPLQLSHVPKDAFRATLMTMGLSEDNAERLGIETGHSVAILRRRLSNDPEVKRPNWARSRSIAKRLLPFALAGSWIDGSSKEDQAVLELLGEVTAEELRSGRDELLGVEDAPIARYGNVNVVVSQIDALFAIGPYFTDEDIGRFFQLYEGLLGERDPALDLPSDQWWMASVLGHDRSYSEALLSGLGDTLCILATHGDAICGKRLEIDVSYKADQMVRRLLANATSDQWLSLRNHLRVLAEAAPSAFLDSLEAELRRSDPSVEAIMGTVSGGVSGDCLRTDLLWSLELLAWLPNSFSRVAAITFDLQRFQIDDNWVNTPANTAASLFCPWLPASTLSAQERIAVLRDLAGRFRLPVLDVCISQLPRNTLSWGSRTSRPRWRQIEKEAPQPTEYDVRYCAVEAGRLILDLAPFNEEEFIRVLEDIERLQPERIVQFVAEAERFASAINDETKAGLRDKLRKQTLYRGSIETEGEEDLEASYQRLATLLEPTRARWRHHWLFDQPYVDWRALLREEDERNISFAEREERVRARREQALRDIADEEGEQNLLNFALEAKHSGLVAELLVPQNSTAELAANWIEQVLRVEDSEASRVFLSQILWVMGLGDLNGAIEKLEAGGHLETDGRRDRFVKCLPGRSVGWSAALQMGAEWETIYWMTTSIRLLNDDPIEDYGTAVRNLLDVGRARSAFWVTQFEPEKISTRLWERILTEILACKEDAIGIPDAHSVDRVFVHLDDQPEISEERIAQLELPYAPLLSRHGHRSGVRTLALHKRLACDPAFFIQLLSWMYKRDDGGADPELDALTGTQKKNLWDIAYHTLEGWNKIPGLSGDGDVDVGGFVEWNETVSRLAGEAGRSGVADIHLGAVYARLARRRSWEDWLPEPTLRLLDDPERGSLRKHFQIGVRNARGTTVRNPYDGGGQERALAKKYQELALRYGNSFARVAEMLNDIARSYDWDAAREDEQAAIGERWQP